MTIYKRIGKSKVPLQHQLKPITENLRKKTGIRAVFLDISSASHSTGNTKYNYSLSFVPGLDGSECSVNRFETWPELLKHYFRLMRS